MPPNNRSLNLIVQQFSADDLILSSKKQKHTFRPITKSGIEDTVQDKNEVYIPVTLDEADNYWSYSVNDDNEGEGEESKKEEKEDSYWSWSKEEEESATVKVLSLDNTIKNLLKSAENNEAADEDIILRKKSSESSAGYWDETVYDNEESNQGRVQEEDDDDDDFEARARRVLSSEHIIANILLSATDYYGADTAY